LPARILNSGFCSLKPCAAWITANPPTTKPCSCVFQDNPASARVLTNAELCAFGDAGNTRLVRAAPRFRHGLTQASGRLAMDQAPSVLEDAAPTPSSK
jgi:hypothetical protein